MPPTMQQQVSEMTEATEATLARTFGWETPEAKLYRDCPTAFWLAPDDGGYWITHAEEPMPTVHESAPDENPSEVVDGLRGAVVSGVLSAGPIFAAALATTMPGIGPDAWYSPFARAFGSLLLAPLTILFGSMLALLPVLVGVLLLGFVGKSFGRLRMPIVWAATGGVMGALIAAMFDAGSSAGPALIGTGALCATIARRFVDWHVPEPG